MEKSKVYILGAGCSFDKDEGYPLATRFLPALTAFVSKLPDSLDRQSIRASVQNTISLLTKCQSGARHASSIDQLINLIATGECDDYLNDLTHPKSDARVLTFNYDRLFELAFFSRFADKQLREFFSYSDGVLNSGFLLGGDFQEIKKDGFCFLKMHGSIGTLAYRDERGQRVYEVSDVSRWSPVSITDAVLLPRVEGRWVMQPLLVFPFEKAYIVDGNQNEYSFRDYTKRTWEHAAYVIREASEIVVIGYSFDPTDCEYLMKLLRQAGKCEHLTIQNLPDECDRIEQLLTFHYKIKTPIIKDPRAF